MELPHINYSQTCFVVNILNCDSSIAHIAGGQHTARPVVSCANASCMVSSIVRPGPGGTCREHEALCAPCGAALTGSFVALTFAYDYFEVAELDSEFEVPACPTPCLLCGWSWDYAYISSRFLQ